MEGLAVVRIGLQDAAIGLFRLPPVARFVASRVLRSVPAWLVPLDRWIKCSAAHVDAIEDRRASVEIGFLFLGKTFR